MSSVSAIPVASLVKAGPAEGRHLARRLADELLASFPPAPTSMPEMLRTGSFARPDPAVIAAIYFHAISLVNDGWRDARVVEVGSLS